MKPLIGISSHMDLPQDEHKISQANVEAVRRAGGIPVVLPNVQDEETIGLLAEKLDGLYVSGGADVDPMLFGEEPHKDLGGITPMRDFFEIAITKKVLALGKPFIGICRGAQVLNVATGGTLYQDIHAQNDGAILKHGQKAPREYGTHFAAVEEGSLLNRLTNSTKLKINSYHHQACKDIGENLVVSAKASDGIVEAIEGTGDQFILGVQWHPEHMVDSDDVSLKIFEGFINACKK